MKTRCGNPKCSKYKYYGARGISVCEEWQLFEGFYEWALSNGWELGLSIERINNDVGYSPLNCKFIPKKEQTRNQISNIQIHAFGRTQILADWARELGFSPEAIKKRIKAGWSIDEAVTRNPKRLYIP